MIKKLIGVWVLYMVVGNTYTQSFNLVNRYGLANLILDNIESAVQNQFTIYPNPTKGLVNVYSTEDNINIQIINIDGKLVKERKIGKGINLINIEEFSAGFYQLRFLDKNGNLKYKQKLSVL